MNPIDRNKIWKMVGILALITVVAGGLLRVSQHSSYTLGDYATDNPSLAYQTSEPSPTPEPTPAVDNSNANATENLQEGSSMAETTVLTGYSLNGELLTDQRTTLSDGFYYEPLSEKLQRYITGVSYPATVDNSGEASQDLLNSVEISYDDLRYVHIRHYNFEGNPAEGELICNKAIAQDLTEIFYELYCNEYQLEKVLLIDEYDGDDTASMEDNNTSCFNYRPVEGTSSLSKHALGLAIDINPFTILILHTIRMAVKRYLLQTLPPMQTEPLPSPTKLTKTICAISYLKNMASPGEVTGTPARITSTSRRWLSNPQSNEGMRSIPSLYGCRQIILKKDNR